MTDVVPSDPQEAEDAAKFFGSPEFRALSNKVTDKFASAHTPKPTAQGQQADNPYYTRSKHISFTDEVTVEFSVPASPKPKLMTFTYNPETKEAKLYADNAVSDLAVERHEPPQSDANPPESDNINKLLGDQDG